MSDEAEAQLALMFAFFEGVARKGPGSDESTLQALSLLEGLPANPAIVEFGCGTGVATMVLAQRIPCQITAVDIHQPFLDELRQTAERAGAGNRITTVPADMANPPFPDHSFDVVWSEAAIYNVGFEPGLKLWKRLLRTGGFVAVSEVVWLVEEPPQMARDFWTAEYPAMTTLAKNLRLLESAGYEPIGQFVLPYQDWDNYYSPLQTHLAEFRQKHKNNPAVDELATSIQKEIDVWKECGTSYGYAFFVGRVA